MPSPAPTTVWMNKRAIAVLDLPLPHAFRSERGGWRVEFSGPGKIAARLVHGGEQHVDVLAGDALIASGEELYLRRAG